jgi:hypothetical protein
MLESGAADQACLAATRREVEQAVAIAFERAEQAPDPGDRELDTVGTIR